MGISEREGLEEHFKSYEEGFNAGVAYALGKGGIPQRGVMGTRKKRRPKKRKLSAWNKFVKANSKKPRFKYRSGKT